MNTVREHKNSVVLVVEIQEGVTRLLPVDWAVK